MGVLLKNISDMRDRGELCDVIVTVEKEKFHVHKLVLAASSDFFHAMFTSGFQEKDKNEIQLIGQTVANFKSFLCYVYSGQVHLTDENIEEVYSIATYLQAGELISYCETYMSNNVNVDNCVKYLSLAEQFSTSAILEKAVKVIATNFYKFCENFSMFKLKPWIFRAVLQHEQISETDEYQILGSVLLWLRENQSDQNTAIEILQEVRWALLDLNHLNSYLNDKTAQGDYISCEYSQTMIKKAIEYLEDERMQPILGGQFSIPRGLPVLAAFGGDTGEFIHEAVGLGDDDISEPRFWRDQNNIESLPMPLHFRECNASVVINNILFLIGGYQYGYDDEDVSDTVTSSHVLKYNPVVNRWRMVASLSTGRAGHSAVAIEYSEGLMGIFVVGGCRKRTGDIPSTAIYDIVNDTWTESDSFPHRVFAPGCCAYNGQIYVSGGRNDAQCMNFMYRYSPNTREWVRLSNMLHKRSSHSMCAVSEHIYIIGVQLTLDTQDNYAEMYDPQVDQYTKIDWIYPFFAEGNCVVHKERIYRVRGECSALTLDTEREEVIKNTFFSYSQFCDGSIESLLDYSTMNSSLAIFHIRNYIDIPDEDLDRPSHEVDLLDEIEDDYDMFFLG